MTTNYIDKIKKNKLKILRNSGWYPHLKGLGYRGLKEFEGSYLKMIEDVIQEVEQQERQRITKLIKTVGATGTEEEVDKLIKLIND